MNRVEQERDRGEPQTRTSLEATSGRIGPIPSVLCGFDASPPEIANTRFCIGVNPRKPSGD